MARGGASERFLAARQESSRAPLIAAGLLIVLLLAVIAFLLARPAPPLVEQPPVQAPSDPAGRSQPVDPLLADPSPSPDPERIEFSAEEEETIVDEAKKRMAADPLLRAAATGASDRQLQKALDVFKKRVRCELAWAKVLSAARDEGGFTRAEHALASELFVQRMSSTMIRGELPRNDSRSRATARHFLDQARGQLETKRRIDGLK